MPRYIDADAFLKLCKDIVENEYNKKTNAGTWSDVYVDVIDLVERTPGVNVQERQSEWISVKDKLPEKKDWLYLVMLEGCRYSLMRYGCDHGKWVWYGFMYRDQVTHWMPLPEPPSAKMDGEGEKEEAVEIENNSFLAKRFLEVK